MHRQLIDIFSLFVRFYSNENQRVHNQQTRTMRSTSNHTRSSRKWSTPLEEAPPILDDDEQDKNQKPAKETSVSRRCGGRKTASAQPILKPKEKEVASKVQKRDLYYVNPKAKSQKDQLKDISKSQEQKQEEEKTFQNKSNKDNKSKPKEDASRTQKEDRTLKNKLKKDEKTKTNENSSNNKEGDKPAKGKSKKSQEDGKKPHEEEKNLKTKQNEKPKSKEDGSKPHEEE